MDLVGSRRSRAEAEDVGDGPGGGVGVVFAEGSFIAAVHFHLEGADVEIELGFGATFEMLGGDDADSGGEEFVVEIVHGEGRTRIDKKDAAGVVFAEGGFAPLPGLLAPLVCAGALDEAQILQSGCVIFLNVREADAGRVEIEDAEWRRVRIVRREGGDGLVGVCVAIVDVCSGAHVAEMSLEVCGEHTGVDGGGEFVMLRPIASGVAGGFAGLADANGFELPEVGVGAEDEDSGVADGGGSFGHDVFVVEAGSDGFPVGVGVEGVERQEAEQKNCEEADAVTEMASLAHI